MKKLLIFIFCFWTLHSAAAQDANHLLFTGIRENNPARVDRAVADGAFLNLVYENGKTPLLLACSQKQTNPKIIRRLINAGADLNYRSPRGETPVLLAVRNHNLRLIRPQAVYGAELNTPGPTPLHEAIKQKSSPEIISVLLQYGASANIPTHLNGRKIYPLTLAVVTNAPDETIRLLLPASDQDAVFQALTAVTVTNNRHMYDLFKSYGNIMPAKP